jgi:integrase
MSSTRYVDVEQKLQKLENSELHPENVRVLREFIDACAAEGISEVRQQRYADVFKALLTGIAPDGFRLIGATEAELKSVLASLNRSDYAESTKHTMRSAIKKFYKIQNGGHEHPDKVEFFSVGSPSSTVTRDGLLTEDELKRLFLSFTSTRDRAMAMLFYESAARPGELLALNISDFTSNEQGDFIFLEGMKDTPDRTNQLIRAGRTLREWLAQHPLGGELGDIQDPSAPLWVKTEQQACTHCGDIPHHHDDENCDYEQDLADRLQYGSFYRRYQQACQKADIPENRRRPYNLRHTRLTEVATFMGYEQLNKFAGWKPGSDRAKVYVHLNNDDVNSAIREEYGLDQSGGDQQSIECPFCSAENQEGHSECRQCGRPLNLEQQVEQSEKFDVLERLKELERKGVLEKLEQLEG